MPKDRVSLFYMAICVIASLFLADVRPDIAAAKPSAGTAAAQIKPLEKKAYRSQSAVRFWQDRERGRWMLHLRYDKCWQIHGKHRRKLCRLGRGMLRHHNSRLSRLEVRIKALTEQILEVGNEEHWNCIHRYERGADGWATNTGNGYYGGLQMDKEFQRDHGLDYLLKKGTAGNWTPREQMAVAERAKRGIRTSRDEHGRVYMWQDRPRGYNPWPNTARKCGLLS